MVKRLLPYLKPLWLRLSAAIVCMAGVAAISTGVIWLIKFLIDQALAQKDFQALHIGIVLVLTVFALKSLLWYSHTYLTAYIGQRVAQRIRNEVYEHLYSLSMGFFNKKMSGGILSRLTNDTTTLQLTLATAPTVVIRDGLTILGLTGFLFYLNLKFAFLSFAILPFAALMLVRLGVKSRRAGREGQAKMGDLYDLIHEGLSAMPIVKIFQNEKKEVDDFKKENRNYFDAIMRLARVEARSSPLMEMLGAFVLVLLLGIGGRDVILEKWTLGSFMAFLGAAMSLYNPIKKFAKVNVQIQHGMASAERVFSLLDQSTTVKDKPGAQIAGPLASTIVFRNVGFSYPGNPVPALQNINLSIGKGEIIALVGASGSGKTTLAQLLLRFYDPTEGEIRWNGTDLRDLTLGSVRRHLSVVTQETHLFNDTVYNNIAYGSPAAAAESVENAARAAFAHEFINKLPQGYQTLTGERGARLSGGERQRIAIARSILKDPSVLILDEATSALDAESEREVQNAFEELLKDRTVFVIAHRLSTIRKADRIVVLDRGKIKESGRHEELLDQKGVYHRLYELHTL